MSEMLAFLLKHMPLLDLLYDAVAKKGVDPEKVVEAIKKEMVAKADEQMREELSD